MRPLSWLSFFLLVVSGWAQSFQAAKPLSPMPTVPRALLSKLAGEATVRVEACVAEDGSVEPSLLQGSGVEDVDEGLLEVLRGWRWQPARRDGEPVESVHRMKFELKFYP